MIGTVTLGPDPSPADRIRTALAGSDPGVQAYLDVGARLDVVSDVHAEPGAVAWRSLHATWDRPWIIAMGHDPATVARCVLALVDSGGPPEGFTVQRRTFPLLPTGLRPVEHWEWDWWFTRSAPPARAGESRVVALDPDDPRIRELLAIASPDAMVRPGDPRIQGWWGIRAGSVDVERVVDRMVDSVHMDRRVEPHAEDSPGDLVAIAAVTSMRAGIPHLGSVATHPDWRGHGLSRDLCSRLTRDALAEGAPAVTLGMHAANRSARAVYSSLGYEVGYRWASGRVTTGIA
jgi:GNAT superfamily N-acetyltransferase